MTDNFSNYANTPTLKQLLDLKQFETMAKINCMRIGIIQSVNGLIAWRIDDKISLKEYYKQQEGK